MNKKLFVLIGESGAGKSTLAKAIIKNSVDEKFESISSGSIVRDIYAQIGDDEKNRDLEFIKENGLSRYNDDIEKVLYSKISSLVDKSIAIILDGYPRNIKQFDKLSLFCSNEDITVNFIYLNTDTITSYYRLKDRNRDDFNEDSCINIIKKQKHFNLLLVEKIKVEYSDYYNILTIKNYDMENNNEITKIIYAISKISEKGNTRIQ